MDNNNLSVKRQKYDNHHSLKNNNNLDMNNNLDINSDDLDNSYMIKIHQDNLNSLNSLNPPLVYRQNATYMLIN